MNKIVILALLILFVFSCESKKVDSIEYKPNLQLRISRVRRIDYIYCVDSSTANVSKYLTYYFEESSKKGVFNICK